MNGDAANANFTIKQHLNYGYNPPKPEIYLEAKELHPGVLTVSDSRLAYVDVDLIWRGFQMLLQKNGNLFPIVKAAIIETICFRYPPVIKNLFAIADLKVKYLADNYLGFSFNPDFNTNTEEVDQIFEEYIKFALSDDPEEDELLY